METLNRRAPRAVGPHTYRLGFATIGGGVMGPTTGVGSGQAMDVGQHQSMVQVSPATRISIGCQWFYFTRDEHGYTVTCREYPEWRLTNEDFAKLVDALVDLRYSEAEPAESAQPVDLTSPGSLLRQALARGYTTPTNESKTLDADLIEAMAREVEALQQFG